MVRNVENLLVQRILFLFLLLLFQCNKICKEEKNEKEINISVSVHVALQGKIGSAPVCIFQGSLDRRTLDELY